MTAMLLLLAWLLPLLCAPVGMTRRGAWLPALAPLAALAAAAWVPVGTEVGLDWVLLGLQLRLDAIGRVFLLFSGLLWLVAGIYAALTMAEDEHAGRLRLFFLLTLAGNLLLILAADMLAFYAGFALMGIAAYGLVVYRRSQRARRAGRVYLAWTLVGELALFCAMVLLAADAHSLRFEHLAERDLPDAAVALLLFGFGIKLALPGLHVWLPVTYAAAPPVAAAVLSGPMMKSGLLGWLRFLPPGAPGLSAWGELLFALGAAGAVLGLVAGVGQRDPRVVLGYSSIAKMGLASALFGAALAQPQAAAGIVAALLLFAMHHLLVKGALFLGVGEWERVGSRPWVLAGLVALSLAMAGAPLTGGSAAKSALVDALSETDAGPGWLFNLSAVATVLLMARFLWLVGRTGPASGQGFNWASASWIGLAGAAMWLPFAPRDLPLSPSGLEPLAIGTALALAAWLATRRRPLPWRGIPPGDILRLFNRRRLPRRLRAALRQWRPW
jgi:formate hydrogenlyase subunit 3/multisubunit Na+/H+ antiporter MnhD subunit